jgi:signal transduction histidine kinase
MFAQSCFGTNIKIPLICLLLVAAAPVSATDVRELKIDPASEKYQLELIRNARIQSGSKARLSAAMAGIDGDGLKELIEGHSSKMLGYEGEDGFIKPRWQMNFPPGYWLHQRNAMLCTSADYNGDGIEEIYTTLVSEDKQDWRFYGFDPATEEVIVNVPLPLGVDRRADGVWDGYYIPAGTVADADGQGRPGIVLLRNVAYDATLRGVCVRDPFTGEMIWEWECGPNPDIENPVVVDLDGDGNNEIILYGTAPDNLGGVKINGYSDDESRLFVLDSQGSLLWETYLGPIFNHGSLVAGDLDGDGLQEIIAFTRGAAVNETHKLTIREGLSGQLICQARGGPSFRETAITPGPRPGTGWIFAGTNDGAIDRFFFDGQTLARDLRVLRDEPHCRVVGAVDILPEPGLEVLVDIGDGALFGILDRDLKPLAGFVEEDGPGAKMNPLVWRRDATNTSLVLRNPMALWILDIYRTPTNYLAMVKQGGYALLIAGMAALVFLLGRWKGRLEGETEKSPTAGRRTADREVMYRLWRQLDDIKHEKLLETSRGLRRLVWLLDAYATNLGSSEDLSDRIRQLMRDYTEVVKPRLEGILQMARGERFEETRVEATAAALAALSDRLQGLTAADMSVSRVAADRVEMKQELEEVEKGLFGLWESLRDYFSTDPVRMLKGMLLVREGEFSRARIAANIVGDEDIPDALCLVDNGDLRYVLDNLVDNAARAMEQSDHRRLLLQVERNNSEISLHVSDTGRGIAPDIQDKIFTGRFSTRRGGGSGLFRSREMLERWGGEITLAESAPGQGTTFSVRLRGARKPEKVLVRAARA